MFWVIWLLVLILSLYFTWGPPWHASGFAVAIMLMFALVGWKVFGPLVQCVALALTLSLCSSGEAQQYVNGKYVPRLGDSVDKVAANGAPAITTPTPNPAPHPMPHPTPRPHPAPVPQYHYPQYHYPYYQPLYRSIYRPIYPQYAYPYTAPASSGHYEWRQVWVPDY
jgi:hypothetical protein